MFRVAGASSVSRALSSSQRVALATSPAAATTAATRGVKTDKMIAGAIASTTSAAVVIGTFHLIVVKVPLYIAAGTIGGAAFSGIFAAFEGEGGGGAGFGSIIGVFLGGIGAYYAKTTTEPWRK